MTDNTIVCKLFGHSWKKWEYVTFSEADADAAYCHQKRVCSRCGEIEEQHIEQHEFSEPNYSKVSWPLSGCKLETIKCNRCGQRFEKLFHHEWSDWIKIADCQYERHCKLCNEQSILEHHEFRGCVCKDCGKENHVLKDNKLNNYIYMECVCSVCGKEMHEWEGCRCKICKIKRDEQHTWDGCKCTKCYKTRDEGHVYDPSYHPCLCKNCKEPKHVWAGCVCTVCGQEHDFKDLDEMNHQCTICGMIEHHQWDSQHFEAQTNHKCKKCSNSYYELKNDW